MSFYFIRARKLKISWIFIVFNFDAINIHNTVCYFSFCYLPLSSLDQMQFSKIAFDQVNIKVITKREKNAKIFI